MFGYDWAPKTYALCQGQQLSIQQNAALFSLLGTFYGGNGVTTFALPDLRGRTCISQFQGPGLPDYTIGEQTGTENVTLLTTNLPQHNHLMSVSNAASTVSDPTNGFLSQGPIVDSATVATYTTTAPNGFMNAQSLATAGANLPVSILQPYLAINFSIALAGIFPSRN